MTRVCLVGSPEVELEYELLSRETSREALLTYELSQPYENTVALQTVSLGAAVSLCNDLNWYLVRFVDEALILEPSISEREWLSRALAERVRNETIEPGETDRYYKLYGVEAPADPTVAHAGRLVEPLYASPVDGELPAYDLREVSETVAVRVTDAEFEG